jgi:hypothetical protein
MILKKITLAILLTILSTITFSQQELNTPKITLNSQYLLIKFVDGVIFLNDETFVHTKLNYNILSEQLHIREKNKIQKLNNPKIDSVRFHNMTYVNVDSKFYQSIYRNDRFHLLYHRKPNLRDLNTVDGAYNITTETSSVTKLNNFSLPSGDSREIVILEDDTGKEVRTTDQFYILKNNQTTFVTKANLYKISAKSKEEIKQFLKKHKLKVNNKEDLIKILDFL